MRMTLRPPELGELVVRLHVAPGGQSATATLLAQHHETGDLLAQAAGDLRQALADRGLRLDRLEVTAGPLTGDARPDGAPSGAPNPKEQQDARRTHYAFDARDELGPDVPPSETPDDRTHEGLYVYARLLRHHDERGGENTMSTDTTVCGQLDDGDVVAGRANGYGRLARAGRVPEAPGRADAEPGSDAAGGFRSDDEPACEFSQVSQLQSLTSASQAQALGQDFSTAVALIGKDVTYTKADGSQASGAVTAVKPDPSGALLEIGTDEVHTGAIVKVQ